MPLNINEGNRNSPSQPNHAVNTNSISGAANPHRLVQQQKEELVPDATLRIIIETLARSINEDLKADTKKQILDNYPNISKNVLNAEVKIEMQSREFQVKAKEKIDNFFDKLCNFNYLNKNNPTQSEATLWHQQMAGFPIEKYSGLAKEIIGYCPKASGKEIQDLTPKELGELKDVTEKFREVQSQSSFVSINCR